MENLKKTSADHVDTHRKLLFLTMLFCSLTFAVKTAYYLLDNSFSKWIGIAGVGLAVLSVTFFVITVFWKLKYIPKRDRYLLESGDNYVTQVMNRASKFSWLLSFVLINLITMTTKRLHSDFPAEFYLNLILFIMLVTFAGSFFILFWRGYSENQQNDTL